MNQVLKFFGLMIQGFVAAMMHLARLIWKVIVWWGWKIKRAFAENRPQDGAAWLVGGLGLVTTICLFGAAAGGGNDAEIVQSTPTARPMAAALTEDEEGNQNTESTRVPSTRATERPTESTNNNSSATKVPSPTRTRIPATTTRTTPTASVIPVEPSATATRTTPTASALPVEPSATATPTTPTASALQISPTSVPPSATVIPPTAINIPPSPTSEPIPPTELPVPSATNVPPPTAVPVVATEVPPPTEAPAPTAPSAGVLVIVAMNKSDEWVDIQNQGGIAIDLGGWVLRSERSDNFDQDCPLGGSIQPGETLRIYAGNVTTGPGFNCGFNRNIWNNEELDPAVLLNPQGQEVSRLNR